MTNTEPYYFIQINNEEIKSIQDFIKNPIIPESINTLKIDFNAGEGNTLDTIGLILVLNTLIEKIKNPSEYTAILGNLANVMVITKQLETQAGLGQDRY